MTDIDTISPMPHNEESRIRALYRFDVLDRPLESELNAIVRLACVVTGASMAVVNLIDRDRQWQPCAIGMEAGEVSRSDSMCAWAVLSTDVVHVADASLDPRWSQNPFTDGRIGHVRMYASAPLVTPNGESIGTLCTVDEKIFDIDDKQAGHLKDLADQIVSLFELRRQAALLANANADLDAFAGMLAHDLRNPLATARGFAELIVDAIPEEDVRTIEFGERMQRSLMRMSELISDVLTYSRNAQGSQFVVDTKLDDVVQIVIENLNQLIDDSGAKIRAQKLPRLSADGLQLTQLLQNLVANAITHGRSDGVEVEITAEKKGRVINVYVDDNGPGVPESHRDKIFDPFTRGQSSGYGHGLGLATCQRIVERHNGYIYVTDSPTLGGARFVVELPHQKLDD